VALKPTTRKKLAACCLLGALAAVPMSEGLRHKAYPDSGGVWTDCYGHTGKDVVPGKYQSTDQCDEKLAADLLTANAGVNSCVHVVLSDGERTAYVDTVYNLGAGFFCKTRLVKRLNAGDHVGACNELSDMVKAPLPDGRKVVLPGLVKRRERMRRLCLGIAS
jgi:lysozyme